MKKIKYLLLPLLVFSCACNNEVIDDLSGTYGDVARYDFVSARTGETEKLKKGLKTLHMTFETADKSNLDLYVVSREWTLRPGNYTPIADPADTPKDMQYRAEIQTNGAGTASITAGQLEVSLIEGKYYISGILSDTAGKRYVLNYRGPLEFTIGVDDPEPSGYMVSVASSPLYTFDYGTMQFVPVPGVWKYTLAVSTPEGAEAAMLELLNAENLNKEQLAGTYPITENAMAAGQMCNGYYFPEYSAVGGSYTVDGNGAKQYLGSGSIELAFVDGVNGDKLLNINGNGIAWTGAGGTGTTTLSIPYATVLEKTGTEVKDQVFHSEILGTDVRYSVLLPKSFDGTREYPVLYMLHGAAGSNNDWLDQGGIANYTGTVDTEMVIIMPQGSFDGFDTFYIDNYASKGLNYETFFITEFIPAMEAMYKGNGKRGLAGLSMGGYGSLYYGLKYTDKFSGMYACSPALAMDGIPSIFDMVWMPGAAPFAVEIGTEDFLYETCKGLNDAMQFSPLLPGFSYLERPGVHDWAFWKACCPKIVSFFNERFS